MMTVHTSQLPWEPTPVTGVTVKELAHYSEGTAKLIRLAPGAEYPLHRHPQRTEYVYVLAGTATLTVADDTHDAQVGDFTLMPADTPHALANYTTFEALLWVGAIMHSSQPE